MAKPAKRPNGRPRLIDGKKQAEIIKWTKLLGSRKRSAAKCGVSYSTLARAFHGDDAFADSLNTAVEEFKNTQVAKIASAADWKARAWLLERMFSEEFGRRKADTMDLPQVATLITQLVSKVFKKLPKKYFAMVEADFTDTLNEIQGSSSVAAD